MFFLFLLMLFIRLWNYFALKIIEISNVFILFILHLLLKFIL